MVVQRSSVALLVALISACGGGGSDGSPVAVSPNPPAPSPAPAPGPSPAPAQPPVQNPAPAPIPAPPPISVPPPIPPTPVPSPPSGPSVSGSAVIRALSTAAFGRATSGDAQDRYFSSAATEYSYSTARFVSRSYLSELEKVQPVDRVNREDGEAVLSLIATTDGSSSFAFDGGGSLTTPQGQFSLSSSSYVVPASVPLDATIYQLAVPSQPGASVRLFVGSILGAPSLIRVCWNLDAPGVLRVVCSRNDRATGAAVGIDTGNDLAGLILTHVSNTDPVRWSIMQCRRTGYALTESIDGVAFTRLAYDASKPNGGMFNGPSNYGSVSVTVNTDGSITYQLPTPYGVNTYLVRDNRFVSAETSIAAATFGQFDRCSVFE